MTFWIEELAGDAADPTEAGRKMRRSFFTLVKLTNRQLTVDLLRKLCERNVGTKEVEVMASRVIRGQKGRRNSLIILELMKMKLKDAEKQLVTVRRQ